MVSILSGQMGLIRNQNPAPDDRRLIHSAAFQKLLHGVGMTVIHTRHSQLALCPNGLIGLIARTHLIHVANFQDDASIHGNCGMLQKPESGQYDGAATNKQIANSQCCFQYNIPFHISAARRLKTLQLRRRTRVQTASPSCASCRSSIPGKPPFS